VFGVENELQTRCRGPGVVLPHQSRRPDSEIGIAKYCVALLRRGNSNRFLAPVARVRRTADGGSSGRMRVPGTRLYPETQSREPMARITCEFLFSDVRGMRKVGVVNAWLCASLGFSRKT
jgi:hypothetical protein